MLKLVCLVNTITSILKNIMTVRTTYLYKEETIYKVGPAKYATQDTQNIKF